MSSEEHVEELVSCGKDEFSVGQLVSVLKECQALVHPDVDEALANESHDAAASEADWEKFYAIIEKLNAPVISLIEAPELDVLHVLQAPSLRRSLSPSKLPSNCGPLSKVSTTKR